MLNLQTLDKTFESRGWTVKYSLSGQDTSNPQKPTVVFVHGTPWSSDVFQPLAAALIALDRYQILLYDLAGYGQSQQLKVGGNEAKQTGQFHGSTSVATQAAILADLLQHLNIDGKDGRMEPAVIAHDIAGTITLRTHLIHQCNFRSLLLLDTNTVLPWGDGFYKLVRSEPEVFLKLPPAIFEAMLRAVIRSACCNPKVLAAGWEDALARPWIGSENSSSPSEERQRSFVRQIAQADDSDVAEMIDADMYTKVRCNVKILWGEDDKWIPREKMNRLAGMLGDRLKSFVTVEQAGHLIMLDQPERVAVEVLEWLSR